jgi:hypothetical protein
VNSRAATVYRILVSAAGSDPHAAALLGDYTQQRQEGQGQIAWSLARAGALRPKLRRRDAADIIHALMSPEVYRLLVSDRGWSAERYQQWLTATTDRRQQSIFQVGSLPDSLPSWVDPRLEGCREREHHSFGGVASLGVFGLCGDNPTQCGEAAQQRCGEQPGIGGDETALVHGLAQEILGWAQPPALTDFIPHRSQHSWGVGEQDPPDVMVGATAQETIAACSNRCCAEASGCAVLAISVARRR